MLVKIELSSTQISQVNHLSFMQFKVIKLTLAQPMRIIESNFFLGVKMILKLKAK